MHSDFIWLAVSALNKPSLFYPTPFTYAAKHSIKSISQVVEEA